jgi:hypothetical protein
MPLQVREVLMGVQNVIVSFTADHASLVLLVIGATLVDGDLVASPRRTTSRGASHACASTT